MKLLSLLVLSSLFIFGACGSDEQEGGIDNEYVGDPCETPEQCYTTINQDDLFGAIECLDRVNGGYCTHECTVDTECCAIEGECHTDLIQVCPPLESAPSMYCLVACEDENLADVENPDTFCEDYVHPAFHCRSTGGGSDNRKVCLPN